MVGILKLAMKRTSSYWLVSVNMMGEVAVTFRVQIKDRHGRGSPTRTLCEYVKVPRCR